MQMMICGNRNGMWQHLKLLTNICRQAFPVASIVMTVGSGSILLLKLLFLLEELQHLRNILPDSVVVQRVEERISTLENCIACNDQVALTHTNLDR
nr:eukaryotic translation initiation factor 6-2-like [Ipomoea batatas]